MTLNPHLFDTVTRTYHGCGPGNFGLEQEYQAIIQALRRIEASLAGEQGRREILERDLATLRENVALLKARIDEIERRLQS